LKRVTCVLIAIASIAAAIWWWSGSGNPAPEMPRASAGETRVANPAESRQHFPVARQAVPGKIEPGPPGQSALPDVRAQFWASKDFWEFAERIHEAAKSGDGAAQYYLSVALNTCDFVYRYYFIEQRSGEPPRIRTLDEAQQLTATRQGSGYTPDDVRDIQDRCQRIMNTKPPPFGNAGEWMDAALASDYPLAQANAAFNKAMQAYENPDPGKSRAARGEAWALVVDSLRSKDAEVILALASTGAILAGEADEQWTWVMAAYLRDPASESFTEWAKERCRHDSQCHPEDKLIDIIRRGAGNAFDEAERRARALNEKIDAGTVEEPDV
jgi:hypothetical protein